MSMSFYANDLSGKWVFTQDEITDGVWGPEDHQGVVPDFTPNPNYLPFADINVNNTNAHILMDYLGLKIDGGIVTCEANEFLQKVNSAVLHTIHDEYVNRRMNELADFAQEAVKRGAVTIYGA